MNISNLKISTRLGVGAGLLLLLMAIVAAAGGIALSSTKASVDRIVDRNSVKISISYRLLIDLNEMAGAVKNYIIYSDKAEYSDKASHEKMLGRLSRNSREFDKDFDLLGTLIESKKERDIFTEIAASRAEVFPRFTSISSLVSDGKKEQAETLLVQLIVPQSVLSARVNSMREIEEEQNRDAVAKMNQDYALAVETLGITLAISVLAGVSMTWWNTRAVTQPVNEAVTLAQAVASGDLTHDVDVTSTNEAGQLLLALRDMNKSLMGVVGQVRTGAHSIAATTGQIAAGNQDLSSRTEEQASSLQETASSMEELTSTVKQNAENAQQASSLALNASEVAQKGGAVVGQVVSTMSEISASSTKISEITGIIEGIAFQTNILALNAAVEAARAGEQGRGFAVVASEVRSLAQRSSSAAKEIKDLIAASVQKIQDGSSLAAEAGSTMWAVTQAVARVTDIMGEIAAASAEQSRGIEQVNQAIAQMDEVTQQNAALVEEAAAAAMALDDQGRQLNNVVAFFQLRDDFLLGPNGV
ncbi:methyl-accepting chemotaxis protein [Burkholderia anthina]|uniref:methyl-accepting chemotaxis protein n=1 Tax=Burkholderia anthina TaxID=179879 RepID=UPI00158CC507|nr:methyl-accepting chemotaxis protein [Burkholderia anthina]